MTRPLDVARWPPWLRERGGSVASAESPASPVTFPTTALVVKVYLAIGADLTRPPQTWSWTDITSYVRYTPGIATTQGRQDWRSVVQTSRAQLVLDNRDGRFSRRNPNSPYYGQLTFNTPIWMVVDPGSGPVTRFTGYVNEWPVRWDRSAKESNVAISCAGILRRLGQGSVLKSPMYRAVLGRTQPTPVAYWPMEDGTDATQVASGLPGGKPMTGTPVFGSAFGGSAGSINLAATADGVLSATITLPNASGFQVDFLVETSGFAAILTASCGSIGPYLYNSRDGINPPPDNGPHHVSYRYVQAAGPSVLITQYYDGVLQYADVAMGGQTLSSTLTLIVRNLDGITSGALSHVAVYGFADVGSPTTRAAATDAYAGELAHSRIIRLCAEENAPLFCPGTSTQAMGAQGEDTFLNLVRECETVDQGVLYETAWGLGYQCVDDRTNAPVLMVLDRNSRHIGGDPAPADDDQRLRNRWTVNRSTGSRLVAEQSTGALGTGAGGPGVYDDSVSVNVESDLQLGDQAYWRLNLGTDDHDRWPAIPVRFHATPDLIPSWVAMPFGGRITVANIASQMTPELIDAVVEGWSERWDTKSWEAVLVTSPFAPYKVGLMAQTTGDTGDVGWMDFDSVTLATAVDTTATSWSVNATPVDAATSDDLPRRHRIGGELITVTAVAGASAPQTWTVTRSVNGVTKAHSAGEAITLDQPFVMAP